MGLLISVEALAKDNHYLVFDCRSHLGNLTQGRADFDAGHIPGAQHADLDQHLSSAPGLRGRHPLPDRDELSQQFRVWGINSSTKIVCYDQNSGAFAARLWWLCRWLGHEAVFVLDGGLDAWIQSGATLSTIPNTYPAGDFYPKTQLTRICEVDEIANQQHTLIDARDAARFRGEVEPIDPIAGHIPGAICAPFSDNMSAGRFKSAAALKERFDHLALSPKRQLVCYCGSGVTATHNMLALLIAGYPEPALYPGSWSEWIANPNRPVETG